MTLQLLNMWLINANDKRKSIANIKAYQRIVLDKILLLDVLQSALKTEQDDKENMGDILVTMLYIACFTIKNHNYGEVHMPKSTWVCDCKSQISDVILAALQHYLEGIDR